LQSDEASFKRLEGSAKVLERVDGGGGPEPARGFDVAEETGR